MPFFFYDNDNETAFSHSVAIPLHIRKNSEFFVVYLIILFQLLSFLDYKINIFLFLLNYIRKKVKVGKVYDICTPNTAIYVKYLHFTYP